MNIDAQGSYKDILSFVNYIENLELLLKIREVNIEQKKEDSDIHVRLVIDFFGVEL